MNSPSILRPLPTPGQFPASDRRARYRALVRPRSNSAPRLLTDPLPRSGSAGQGISLPRWDIVVAGSPTGPPTGRGYSRGGEPRHSFVSGILRYSGADGVKSGQHRAPVGIWYRASHVLSPLCYFLGENTMRAQDGDGRYARCRLRPSGRRPDDGGDLLRSARHENQDLHGHGKEAGRDRGRRSPSSTGWSTRPRRKPKAQLRLSRPAPLSNGFGRAREATHGGLTCYFRQTLSSGSSGAPRCTGQGRRRHPGGVASRGAEDAALRSPGDV